MPVLTLKVSAELAARLERTAARRRLSKSAVIREALEAKLRRADDRPSVYDLMQDSVGCLDSRVPDLGHNPARLAGFGRK